MTRSPPLYFLSYDDNYSLIVRRVEILRHSSSTKSYRLTLQPGIPASLAYRPDVFQSDEGFDPSSDWNGFFAFLRNAGTDGTTPATRKKIANDLAACNILPEHASRIREILGITDADAKTSPANESELTTAQLVASGSGHPGR